MKKVVLRVDVPDEKSKRRAIRMVSTLYGIDSITMDMKEKKLTLTGDLDPIAIVSKLRKVYLTEILSVGPLKEGEKKKDEPKKGEAQKKDEPKKAQSKDQVTTSGIYHEFYTAPPPYPMHYSARSIEEDPNACVIC